VKFDQKGREVMQSTAVSEKVSPDAAHSDPHEGKMSAMVFPLAERLECEQTAESEDELSDQQLSLEDEIVGERDFGEIIGNNTRLKVLAFRQPSVLSASSICSRPEPRPPPGH
jgi:hypothetical protein